MLNKEEIARQAGSIAVQAQREMIFDEISIYLDSRGNLWEVPGASEKPEGIELATITLEDNPDVIDDTLLEVVYDLVYDDAYYTLKKEEEK